MSSIGLTTANVDADLFNKWLEQDLMPKLPANAVLVMDNATFHKRADTRARIEAAGHTLEYLPPHSPDLNPIEQNGPKPKPSGAEQDEQQTRYLQFKTGIKFESSGYIEPCQ